MKNSICNFVSDVLAFETNSKEEMKKFLQQKFNLHQDGKVYFCDKFAVRISFSKNNSFSNTVLSLSKLQKFDNKPFFVVLVRGNGEKNSIFLANTTFLSKISHSSQKLSETNIKGSFNGSDIIKTYQGLDNCTAENFEDLFAYHSLSWEENLQRLVFNTNNIVPTKKKFEITTLNQKKIFSSIELTLTFLKSKDFEILYQDLENRLKNCQDAILCASHVENTNIRGRLIEALITSDESTRSSILKAIKNEELPTYDTKNSLGDYRRTFSIGTTHTDIKTKILYLHSNPKAYNIDKFLETMSDGQSIFLFYLIGINETGIVSTKLVSVYHNTLIDNINIQSHWAGLNTRGVTQLNGKYLNKILNCENFVNCIDVKKAKSFLQELISL